MAGHNPARFDEIRAWPLRDLFLCYLAQLREDKRVEYFVEYLVWAMLAPHQKHADKPPALPRILKGV